MECSVCMEAFNHEARRPKSLPCGHSFCLRCLQNPAINNLCPQDRQAFEGDPMALPDNFALLAVVAEARADVVWCEFCRRDYTGACADAGHRPYSERQRQAAQHQQLGAGVAELQRAVEEMQRQVQELQQRVAQPAPRLEMDVKELSSTRELRIERNDLLLGDQLTQVRKLTGLDCGVDAAWAEAVLLKVAPHLEKLHVENVKLQHLRAIQGMSALKKLHLECYGLRSKADVPLLPLQLERLHLEEFRKGHLVSLQWMPKLRDLYLIGYEDIPITFSRMPDHCGIRRMTVGFDNTATLLSLVRAHATTLEVLSVNIASSDEYETWLPNFSQQLHECGLVALRELVLYRNDAQHDEESCRVQMRVYRTRFGPDVVVECSQCHEA